MSTGTYCNHSWSKSGRLLASGSDDQHLNIHTYQPDSSTSQFALTTTVATGHSANIFSVKFMPHSNDRTLITAAGDHEVRIFDIEYSGSARQASSASTLASHGRPGMRRSIYNGANQLSDGDTNCRVYRSHGDRVKRIVTESSPHLFLTCSEDGEVRQWDLRQPSSAYPSPRARYGNEDDTSVPPPLISYKRWNLDLNTISCSPSQPHYIAMGGAHLHCFLHDRRMTGRDILAERGSLPSPTAASSDQGEELMGQATRCVRKFAPNGQPRMRRTDSGHITACKISDAYPNEMVVSWSGDHIYSFDLVRSPDASEKTETTRSPECGTDVHRVRESSERKRKRKTGSHISLSQEGAFRAHSRQRTESSASRGQEGEMALRVQYQNGQCEDIPIEPSQRPSSPISFLRESVLNERQQASFRLAKATVQLRKSIFTLASQKPLSDSDITGHATSFTAVLGYAASILPDMYNISSNWRYPIDPSPEDVMFQRTLRSHRDSATRFVQAAGVIARALGGRLQTTSSGDTTSSYFNAITFATNEGPDVPKHELFGYDFLKAIFLWLDSGVGALLEGFSSASPMARNASRLPVPKNSGTEAIDEILIPYLLELASDNPIVNVDASRFEVDENRILYPAEKEAVLAFAAALKIPFADLASGAQNSSINVQSRPDAIRIWGLQVARGVLMNAGEGVNFAFVDSAFGGIGTGNSRVLQEEASILNRQEDIDPTEEEPGIRAFEIMEPSSTSSSVFEPTDSEEEDVIAMSDLRAMMEQDEDEDSDEDEEELDENASIPNEASSDDEDGDAHFDDGEEEVEEDDEDEDEAPAYGMPFYRSAFERRRLREKVEDSVPCTTHSRVYAGHCNVRTVKDVNFFGLQDEYVVSGSDDGNLFIWDRKSSQLVNILEGDGEVVNVLQGHPYEPLLAVSGIDHTIKIFSPDSRAREAARLGRGVEAADASGFSSITWPARAIGRRTAQRDMTTSEPAMAAVNDEQGVEEDEEYVASGGLASRKRMHEVYQITSRNDIDRQSGNNEALVTVSLYLLFWFGG